MTSAYSASKAALRPMARGLASELLPHGIRVNSVGPGPIDTPILNKVMPKAEADQIMLELRDRERCSARAPGFGEWIFATRLQIGRLGFMRIQRGRDR